MENEYLSPSRLKSILELLRNKEARINPLVNNLKINDVQSDSAFDNSSARIKRELLVTPVTLGDGTFVDHEYKEIPLTFQQQVVGGLSRHHYYHQIRFPFSGDSDLFVHTPETWNFSSSDRGIIAPDNASIDVFVDLPALNPDDAVVRARTLLSMNMQFANLNNQRVETWNGQMEQVIDERLKTKRAELLRLFGSK